MKKINCELLVCTAEQAQQLIKLGIQAIGCFCYTPFDGDGLEFDGEYIGQENAIPAWTMEEVLIMIGGDYNKPDLLSREDWTPNINMLQFALYLPEKRKDYKSGAQAAAELLRYLISKKEISPADANERLEHFISKQHYNVVEKQISADLKNKK